MLHDACFKAKTATNNSENTAKHPEHVSNNCHVSPGRPAEVLLATALVRVVTEDGSCHILRAFIDQGSQLSLISETAAQRLGVKRTFCSGVIYGIGEKSSKSKGMISITCKSMYSEFRFTTNVLIMNSLVKNLPCATYTKPSWPFIQNLDLADPEFYVSRPIDLLLGSDIYALIKMEGISRSDEPSHPLAEQTQLGWILFGKMAYSYQCNVVLNNVADIQRFWEVEDIEVQSEVSSEEQQCIDFYLSTTVRQRDGRYVVRLPLKQEEREKLGTSRGIAVAQFRNLEKKFDRQASLAEQYKAFINEYIALHHMIPASNVMHSQNSSSEDKQCCFLPHHAVQRAESSTTKLRVVFNASAKTSSGYSLNDIMKKGPNLQKDLQSLIIKWRQYRYAFTSDIEKMYRQILVNEEDQRYQQIVWRETTQQPIQPYQLTTVTYGTKAAPFLAMMTLKQLADDERSEHPEAAQVLKEAMYMDDLVHGSHDIESGKRLIAEVNHVLRLGGFTLRKWISNEPELLQGIENRGSEQKLIFNYKAEGTPKTLGLRWDSEEDKFTFQYDIADQPSSHTKRTILSQISKLFDPLGWLAPLSTKLKLLFQRVWSANLEWDDVIPEDIEKEWIKIQSDIASLKQCEIPRWIGYQQGDVIELHGFCDASLKAYAGVIYARIIRDDRVTVVLVASKTRLVPNNKAISLPRLEMCGAQLLSKLMNTVVRCLDKLTLNIYGWTDSMVVLGWLQGDIGRWKTFVANRVKCIAEIVPPNRWRYVKSGENPADAASRGLLASQLASNTLWWQGPEWLKTIELHHSEIVPAKYTTDEECKRKQVNVIQQTSEESIILGLLQKYSSFVKITRILAWILRALNTIKQAKKSEEKHKRTYLTLRELKRAKMLIIKYVQRCEFGEEIENIQKHKDISNKSKLLKLNPFLDKDGILRVGGRLKSAQIHSDMKYPIVLPYSSILTSLLIEQAHQLTYHGGPRLTLANLRQKYWILSGNRAVKKELRKCVKCRKYDPKQQYQLMGNLPPERLNPAPPFYHTGVDYTGYVEVKANKGRGIKTTKGYVALFICMVTKAVHLELVSDLSSTTFLASLRRMAARKGAPRHMYSDNGTNFVGANRVLQKEYYDLKNCLNESFYNEIADLNIEWHFNAPTWASAGGLWERAIRSLKHHLKRVVGEQKLTYEEFSTMLAQLEACLNSRPLCPLSEDIEDLDFLTPAHFLIGRAGSSIIETAEDARSRWYLANKLAQDIWKRFKTEYLTQLSVRSKWLKQQDNLKVGQLVTIQDENLPPSKWLLGRVIELHPGLDGLVRVVSLKTKNGILKRPVVKLSILPVPSSTEEKQKQEDPEASTTSESTKSSPRKKKAGLKTTSTNFISMAISFILFMTLLSGSYASYNITKINNYQGLYFDKIGNMRLARDEWKLVVYYNMDPYWEGMAALEKHQTYLKSMCTSINTLSHCDVILLQLRHSFLELEFTNRVLLGQQNGTRSRQRRGLINGIGYLANALFGVLDEHFAEQYQKDISLLRNNQKHLATLWRNQTSVVEGEYNILQRIGETISKQHKAINSRINEISKAANTLKEEIKSVEIMNEFMLSAMIANNLILNIRNIQEQLVDMLIDIHHQRFNTHILSPQQLQDELNIISGQLTNDLSLPIEHIHLEMAKMYHLLKVKARLTNEYFIFEIRIPLITRDTYELHKVIPIPLQRANNSISITPVSDYVAVNLKKDTYLPLTESEIQQCSSSELSSYVCDIHTTVYHMKKENGQDLCTYDPAQRRCQTSIAACNNMWIRLNKANNYLLFCCGQCALRFMCGDQVTVEQLSATCIISLDPDCIVKHNHFTAYAHNNQLAKILHIDSDVYSPQIAPINHLINISLSTYGNETADSELNLELLKFGDQIKQMKNVELAEDDPNFYHHIHHYVINYGLVSAALLAAAVCLWRKWRRARTRVVTGRDLSAPPTSTSNSSVVSARKQRRATRVPIVQCLKSSVIQTDTATSPIPRRVFNISENIV